MEEHVVVRRGNGVGETPEVTLQGLSDFLWEKKGGVTQPLRVSEE